jgi:hypothetical protein
LLTPYVPKEITGYDDEYEWANMETSGSITDDNLMASDSKVIGCALVW